MRLLKFIFSTSLVLSTSHLFAAQATEQQVQKLMEVMQINQLLQKTLQQIRPQIDQQAYSAVQHIVKHDKLTPQEQIVANELADQMYKQNQNSISWEKLKPIYQKIYTDVYSAEEVQAQIDFYSSHLGQSILAKSPIVAQESMKIINTQLMTNMQVAEKDFATVHKKLEQLKNEAAKQ